MNVNSRTETKNGLTYLSWAWAWQEFKRICPDATYEIKKFPDENGSYAHIWTAAMTWAIYVGRA